MVSCFFGVIFVVIVVYVVLDCGHVLGVRFLMVVFVVFLHCLHI